MEPLGDPHGLSPHTPIAEIGEREALRLFVPRLGPPGTLDVPNGDDAAAMTVPQGETIVVSTDTLSQDTHFRREWTTAFDLGWKLIASSVSDLAAMAASPRAVVIALSAPAAMTVGELLRLADGIRAASERYGLVVAGGDTTAASGLTLTATVIGSARAADLALRSAARPGDRLYVTGSLGDAATGCALLERARGAVDCAVGAGHYLAETVPELARGSDRDVDRAAIARFLRPEARCEWSMLLAGSGVRAMIDVSDGLATDVNHLARSSGVGAVIFADRLPVGEATRAYAAEVGGDAVRLALEGGEDYELLFTAPPAAVPAIEMLLAANAVEATWIGEVSQPGGPVLLRTDSGSERLGDTGYDHFAPV